jgi:hypothetical protein
VDDGLTSLTDKEQAIKLVKRTQKSLMDNGHIRLHKIVSNNVDVMKAFSTPTKLLVRSGPDIKRLFKETPSKIADESKTPLI